MMLAFATAAAFIAQPGHAPREPAAADFDLARSSGRAATHAYVAPPAPVAPRNLDTRDFAVDAPEIAMPLAENGPQILVGVVGGKHGDKYRGLPKLAHVALGWSF